MLAAIATGPLVRPATAQRPQASLLISVVDSVTGRPLEDVEVLDLRTRTSARTTSRGTVALTHVDSAGALVTLRKIGYRPLTRLITNASHDGPLTLTLAPLPQPVPRVVTAGRAGDRNRGPADTLRVLELNGFYERRVRTAAPASAFVTEEKLARLTTLANLPYLTGRGVCMQNLYVDGVRLPADRFLFRWLRPEMVAAIELYTHAGEIPALYNVTLPSGSPSNCATLVWTK
jgi:hypothetical protein